MGNQTSKSGSFIQTVPSAPEKATAEGKWVTTFQGTKWVTPDVISGPEIIKEPYMMGGEKWGYYKKQYTKSIFGGTEFTLPNRVDGNELLCQCRYIQAYVREQSGGPGGAGKGSVTLDATGALLFGSNRPACWDDDYGVKSGFLPTDTYYVVVGHPDFYKSFMFGSRGTMGLVQGVMAPPAPGTGLTLLGARAFGGKHYSRKIKMNRKTRRRRSNK